MSDETNTSAGKPREYSQAEIDKMRRADIDDYKKENAWLEQRVKNITLLAELEVQETRRLMAIVQRYQITRQATPQEPNAEGKDGDSPQGQDTPKAETPQGEAPLAETPPVETPAAEAKPARTLKSVPQPE